MPYVPSGTWLLKLDIGLYSAPIFSTCRPLDHVTVSASPQVLSSCWTPPGLIERDEYPVMFMRGNPMALRPAGLTPWMPRSLTIWSPVVGWKPATSSPQVNFAL